MKVPEVDAAEMSLSTLSRRDLRRAAREEEVEEDESIGCERVKGREGKRETITLLFLFDCAVRQLFPSAVS